MPFPNQESVDLQYLPSYDYTGGLVTNYSFALYKQNQLLRALNADLVTDGAISKRKGRTKLTSRPVTLNSPVTSLFALGRASGSDTILGGHDTRFSIFPTAAAPITLRSGLTAGAQIMGTQLDNYLFLCNGYNQMFMTQGSPLNTYVVGLPEVSPAQYGSMSIVAGPVVGAAGLTAGTHRFSFRYRSTITGARSVPLLSGLNIVGTIVVTAVGGESIIVTIGAGVVNPDPQVDFIDIFMQEANADIDSPYYFIATVPNAVSLPITIPNVTYFNISDNAIIVEERLDTDDRQPPLTMRDVEIWKGRIIGIKDDYHVVYSKQLFDGNSVVNLPTSWPGDNELEVGFGDGDPLVKVVRFYDYILAFKSRSVWILIGDVDSNDFGFKRLKANYSNVGLLNPRAIAQAGNSIYFVTDDLKFLSFAATDFSTEELRVSDPALSDSVADLFTSFASSYRQNVNLANNTWGQYSQILISFSDGTTGLSGANNFNCFVYDYDLKAWTIHTKIEIASSVLARDVSRNYRVFAGDYWGYVWKLGDTDGDGAIVNATALSSTSTSVTFAAGTLPVAPATAIDGTFIQVIAGAGAGQIRRISSTVGSTVANITTAWTTLLDATSEVTIGGIDFQVQSRWDWCALESPPDFDKYAWYLDLDLDLGFNPTVMDPIFNQPVGGGAYGFGVEVQVFVNRQINGVLETPREIVYPGSAWDISHWDIDTWSDDTEAYTQVGLDLYFKQISFRITNNKAGQPVKLNGHTWCFQNLQHVRPT